MYVRIAYPMLCYGMGMEDEDCFVTIGTAFEIPEEDESPKKRFDKHEQIAVDSKGRRRFHGAFTGGFSAGYFNTVGTKEGWTPTTFRSSRSNRVPNDAKTQKPEHFMDEEDFGEHGIAPRLFMTKESFTPADKEIAERKRAITQAVSDGVLRSAVPGGIPIHDLILPSKVSTGIMLLKKMGWKEGQGVGPKQDVFEGAKLPSGPVKKVYGCSLPSALPDENAVHGNNLQNSLAPKDLQPIDFRPKDNTHGIGYSGIDPKRVMLFGSDSVSESFKPTGAEKRGIKGQAFGIGAFEEEDEDIYTMDDMSDYDFAAVSERESARAYNFGWSGPPKRNKSSDAITGFTKASIPTAINKIFRPPSLPRNFIPKHEFKGSVQQTRGIAQHGTFLTSSDRSLLLGEKTPKRTIRSVFDIVPEKDKKKLEIVQSGLEDLKKVESSTRDVSGHTPDTHSHFEKRKSRWDSENKLTGDVGGRTSDNSAVFKPFENDPSKQKRYDAFLLAKRCSTDIELKYDGSMTEWEKEREMEEFARASILYRPMSTSMSSRFTRGSLVEDSRNDGKKDKSDIGEKSDFEKAAKLSLFGRLTRQAHDWYPSSLLCKRFNVPDPYPHSQFTGTISMERKLQSSYVPSSESATRTEDSKIEDNSLDEIDVGNHQFAPMDRQRGLGHEGKGDHGVKHTVSSDLVARPRSFGTSSATSGPLSYLNDVDKERRDESLGVGHTSTVREKEEDTERPPMDLFKAIFADTSDTSGDESDIQEEKAPQNDLHKVSEGTKAPQPPSISTSHKEIVSTGDSFENTNENIADTRMAEVHRPSFETRLEKECDAGRSLPPCEAEMSLGGHAEQQYVAKDRVQRSRTTDIEAMSMRIGVDELTKSQKSDRDSKGNDVRGYREEMKKKKSDRKQKKKTKKEKKKTQKKKSREYEKDSSSEWSSCSGDDYASSRKFSAPNDRHGLSTINKGVEKSKIENTTKKCDVVKSKNPYVLELSGEVSINDKMKHNIYVDKFSKKSERSGETLEIKQDDTLLHKSCEREAPHSRKSSINSLENPQQPLSARSKRKPKKAVPSATEIYQKLKKHGLTLKRMTAADFM